MRSHKLMFAALLSSVVCEHAFAAAIDKAEMTQLGQQSLYEGDWQGAFGDGTIKIRLALKDGEWRGWFISETDGSLYPLQNVQIDEQSVKFDIATKPRMSFHLKMGKDKNTLSGINTWSDGRAIPQTFERI